MEEVLDIITDRSSSTTIYNVDKSNLSENISENTLSNLSKKQLKRLKKQQFRKNNKILKKENKKKRKADEIKDNVNPLINDNLRNDITSNQIINNQIIHTKENISKKFKKEETLTSYRSLCKQNFSLIIDCNYEDLHNDNTLKSLTQQIMFCYGINRRHSHPASLYITGIGNKLKSNLDKVSCDKWVDVNITTEDYFQHPHFTKDSIQINTLDNAMNTSSTIDNIIINSNIDVSSNLDSNIDVDVSDLDSNNNYKKKQLVYLTSDAEDVLETLDPNCAYIIGGIVDRNRYKGITYKKACQQNIKTAKLPIKEYFSLVSTHVLTVNHVYEIILNYVKYKDWKQAIKEVIPERKGSVVKEDCHDNKLDNHINNTNTNAEDLNINNTYTSTADLNIDNTNTNTEDLNINNTYTSTADANINNTNTSTADLNINNTYTSTADLNINNTNTSTADVNVNNTNTSTEDVED